MLTEDIHHLLVNNGQRRFDLEEVLQFDAVATFDQIGNSREELVQDGRHDDGGLTGLPIQGSGGDLRVDGSSILLGRDGGRQWRDGGQ